MTNHTSYTIWDSQSPDEKEKQLFCRQKEILDTFLEKGAVSHAQHDKILTDLMRKMAVASYVTIRKADSGDVSGVVDYSRKTDKE